MSARLSKSIVSVLVIAALALAIVPFAGAQEGGTEANKALVMRFNEELWGGNFEVADEILAEDFVARFPDGAVEDRETYLAQTIAPNLAAMPDFSIEINALLFEGDLVAIVYNWGGTFENEFFGIPPTGKPMRLNGIDFMRIENGKIAEFVLTWSTLSAMQQMGVVPAEGEVMLEQPWTVSLGETSSTPEQNKVMTFNELAAINENRLDWMDGIATPDFVAHWSMQWTVEGRDAWKQSWADIKAGTPEHRVAPGYTVAEGDLVAFHSWMYSPWPGLSMACLDRYEDGKLAEQWCVWDTLGVLEAGEGE